MQPLETNNDKAAAVENDSQWRKPAFKEINQKFL